MFDQCLYFNTTALARVLDRVWTDAFAPFGLTPSQAFLLRAVLDQPGMLQRELAREMAISRPTATRSLDGLQEKGLVERRDSERDGREYEIHPTAAAMAIKTELNAASAEVTRRLKREFGVAMFEETVRNVKEIRATLNE
ncbi:MAG: MarR family transcriptional regulator [Candidatus Protistobacter heckmanni]|nr:MarR family transcriptional regulator [Candidatus Protistobacter heckmanni]